MSEIEHPSPEQAPEPMGTDNELSEAERRLPLPVRRRRQPQEKKRGPRRRRKIIILSLLAAALLSLCSAVSFLVLKYYGVYTFLKSSTSQTLPSVNHSGPQGTALPDDLSGVDHFNILLLGSDNDSKFHSGAVLTQTDIVVRVDLAQHKVTMVSIPRDMWLTRDDGVCCNKLDEISNVETDGVSGALNKKLHGFAHTAATIEADFGIPINAYAWVGLDGFVKVIDTLGGVDVDVLHPIVDDAYPKDINNNDPFAYQRLYIPSGPQHLDGQEALDYVRSRHSDLLGDFGRSARQQSVLVALKKKLDIPSILGKLDQFATDLQGSVLTSLSINQVIQLANFARGLSPSDFRQYVLGIPTYAYYGHANGQSIVQPIWSEINRTVKQIFSDSTTTSLDLHNLSATDTQTISKEHARILIENGSGTAGVGDKLKTLLANDGFTVVGVQDADRVYLATQVEQFSSGVVGTARILGRVFGVLTVTPGTTGPPGADIVLIIGKDVASALT